jgi:hypothetical protein
MRKNSLVILSPGSGMRMKRSGKIIPFGSSRTSPVPISCVSSPLPVDWIHEAGAADDSQSYHSWAVTHGNSRLLAGPRKVRRFSQLRDCRNLTGATSRPSFPNRDTGSSNSDCPARAASLPVTS